jgi:hypothetical protein
MAKDRTTDNNPASPDTIWRSTGPYLPTNASKAGLLDETRQFLMAYGRLGDIRLAADKMIAGGFPQRSRDTRVTVMLVIRRRLFNWRPPSWVLDDLASLANNAAPESLQATLLLHAARQDRLLYDVVQQVIVPQWAEGQRIVSRADMQRFLDASVATHPEIEGWSRETREKLAGNLLTILRDYGMLQGTARKQIVEPIVPPSAVRHLAWLLTAEGITPSESIHHPDWRLWLMVPERVGRLLVETAPVPAKEECA